MYINKEAWSDNPPRYNVYKLPYYNFIEYIIRDSRVCRSIDDPLATSIHSRLIKKDAEKICKTLNAMEGD